MNRSMLLTAALFAALFLVACEKPAPIIVNVPVPGPAGPQGATGDQGSQGSQGSAGAIGEAGKPGAATTVIVMPPAASAPGG